MPIRGLTDRESVTPRLTPIGQIRKGTKDEQGKMIDLEYFRFIAKGPKREAVQAAFEVAYGKEPRLVRVVTPYPTVEENWVTWFEQWGDSGLIHRCDGKYMVQWLDENKRYVLDYELEQKRLCPYCSGERPRTKKDSGCSEVGRLIVAIPELLGIGFLGYVTVITTSKNDLVNITASLLDTEQKARIVGREFLLAGVPFAMHRVEENIGIRYKKKNGDTVKTKGDKWMIRLDPTQKWGQQMLQEAMDRAIGLPAPTPVALPEPQVDLDTGEVLGVYEEPDELPNPFDEIEEPGAPGDNGHSPTQEAQPMTTQEETARRTQWEEYYARTWAEAQALDLDADPLPADGTAMIDEIKAASKELAERVKHAKLLKRWRELWDKGQTLGIEVAGITDDTPNDEIERKGKELAGKIAEAEAQIPVEQGELL